MTQPDPPADSSAVAAADSPAIAAADSSAVAAADSSAVAAAVPVAVPVAGAAVQPDAVATARLAAVFLALAFVTWLLIGFGALVRGNQAGLACPDWPLCHGALVPDLALKGVVYEWGHRLLAGAVSVLYAACTLWLWRIKSLWALLGRWAAGAGALLMAQIVLGGLTVLIVDHVSGVARPADWTVTLHLILGNLFAAAVLLIGLRLRARLDVAPGSVAPGSVASGAVAPDALARRLLVVWTAVLAGQFVLGGIIASNLMGLVCNEFPTCAAGQWFPTLEGFVGLQILHRLTAYALAVLAISLAWTGRRTGRFGRSALGLVALIAVQVSLGAANIWFHLVPWVTAGHTLGASALVLITAVLLRDAWRPVVR